MFFTHFLSFSIYLKNIFYIFNHSPYLYIYFLKQSLKSK